MRLLIMILGLVCAASSMAAERKTALSVLQKQHHSTQYSTLYREGDKWYCDSDLGARHPIMRKPASLDLAKRLKKAGAGCTNSFQVEVAGEGKRAVCVDHDVNVAFLQTLAKECGRF